MEKNGTEHLSNEEMRHLIDEQLASIEAAARNEAGESCHEAREGLCTKLRTWFKKFLSRYIT